MKFITKGNVFPRRRTYSQADAVWIKLGSGKWKHRILFLFLQVYVVLVILTISKIFQLYTIQKENLNPIDNNLELADPTPSIHDLFVRFNKKFFWGSLDMVQVLWSNRMTRCAGLCYFEGRHGLCKISLSAPLLSLRPRKDLVETLLVCFQKIHKFV